MLSDAIQDHPTETFTILFIAAVMIQNVIIHWAVDKKIDGSGKRAPRQNAARRRNPHSADHRHDGAGSAAAADRTHRAARSPRNGKCAGGNGGEAAAESKATAAKAAKTPTQQSDLGRRGLCVGGVGFALTLSAFAT